MGKKKNIKVVKELFNLFSQGEIPSAMQLFDDKVEFQSPVTSVEHDNISWSRKRRNKEEIMSFFQEMNDKVQTEVMKISAITAQKNRVIVEGNNAGTIRSTGKRYFHDWVMTFEIRNGKIIKNHHYYDTADLEIAF